MSGASRIAARTKQIHAGDSSAKSKCKRELASPRGVAALESSRCAHQVTAMSQRYHSDATVMTQ